VDSLSVTACPISHMHRTHGLANPMTHQSVPQVHAGLRRIHGVAPRRQTRPLTVPELRQILTAIDRGTVFGARDAAIILKPPARARRAEIDGPQLPRATSEALAEIRESGRRVAS
jgi:hypothetical protein